MKRSLMLTVVIILLVSLIAGCGGNADKNAAKDPNTAGKNNSAEAPKETVKLTLMNGMVEIVDWLNEEIETFNEQNPGIKVQQEFLKEGSGALKVKIAAGDMPDIIMGIGVPQDYLDQDLMRDFANDKIWDRLVDPSFKQAAADPTRPDKVFAIPFNMIYQGMFYNKQVLEEAGVTKVETWEEFVTALKTIKEKKPEVAPLFLGGKDAWTLGQLVSNLPLGAYQQQYGIKEVDKLLRGNDPQLGFDQPGGRIETFAKNMLDLKAQGLVNENTVTATYSDQTEAIANGKAAFVIQGMWALGDMLKKNPNASLGFFPIPPMFTDAKPYMIGDRDGSISVPAKSEHPEEVQKFIDFITSPDALKGFSKVRNSPSAYKDAQIEWSILSDDVDKIKAEGKAFIATKGTYTPSGYGWDQFGKTVQDLLAGGIKSPQDFAKSFKQDWEKAQR